MRPLLKVACPRKKEELFPIVRTVQKQQPLLEGADMLHMAAGEYSVL